MNAKDRDQESLRDIMDALDAVVTYASVGLDRFMSDRMVRDAIERRFITIGEAIKRLSREFRTAHAHVAWDEAARFRDYLVHIYDEVRPSRVWEILQGPVVELRKQLSEMRRRKDW